MADLKISQLTGATTPLTGTEVLPVVQGGTTKKVSVTNILAPAAGNGVDFAANTPTAGATSQLLDWYEEGDYTPSVAAAAGSITSYTLQSAKYTRIGRLVFATVQLTITNAGTGVGALLISVPYNASGAASGSATETAVVGDAGRTRIGNGDNTMYAAKYDNTSFIVNNYVITASITYSV